MNFALHQTTESMPFVHSLIGEDEDDLFMFADDESLDSENEALNESEPPRWKILIVDDEPSVISVTELALRHFSVDARLIQLTSALSAEQARDILGSEDDFAVVVTDVVMETDSAGLDLTRWMRERSKFDATRLVIRTGQPGTAPEETVLANLEINDYWPKTEVTAHRMRTILTGLIRSYRDIRTVEAQNVELKAMQERLFAQERLKVMGELVSGIAHDFNNALTPITAFASILLEDDEVTEEERVEFLNIIMTAGKDAAALVERLRSYYRPGGQEIRHAVSMSRLLADTRSLASPRKEHREFNENISIRLSYECSDDFNFLCHEPEMRQSLLNLVINAIDVVGDGGEVILRGYKSGSQAIIEVIDNGSGMSDEILANCRDAFFSTKGDKGTGLGLAMVARTVEEHGGTLDIESAVGQGTTVRVSIPNHDQT